MSLARTMNRALVAVLLGGCLPTAGLANEPKATPGTPANPASLEGLEQRVRDAAAKVMPAVVAVEGALKSNAPFPSHHEPFASGAIISADGLILSQYHVSHLLDVGDFEKSRQPGERVKVILHDGRVCEAKLLGADRGWDLSLLQLVKPGPYPCTPLDDKATVQLGDGVLKLGHPMGYRRGRDPVVRFGRVVCRDEDSFVSDCLVTGGDSGGPLFDLDGRFVGIVRNSAVPGALGEFQNAPRRAGILLFTCSTTALVRTRMEAMRRGAFPAVNREALTRSMERFGQAEALPGERWSQGAAVTTANRAVVHATRPSVVAIQDRGTQVALGTIVGADGWIATKGSVLPAEPTCRLPDGRVVAAEVAGIDPAFDLALLKVPTPGLRPVEWADERAPVAGTFLAVPGLQELPLAVGVVSVPRRDLPGPFPTRLDPPRKVPAALPGVIGSAVQGRGYWVEFAEGMAAAAGIQPGDVILTIAGKAVRRHQDLADCVRGQWAGTRVPVRVLRAGKPLEFTLALRAEGGTAPFSARCDDFPTVFEHDAPLLADECGGPIVGLKGQALGITIARVGPHGCMAIPGDCVRRLLPDLQSGKLAGNWTTFRKALSAPASSPRPAEPKSGKSVTFTLEELKEKLEERRERFKSLFVEYDVTSEAHVEPRLLMAWDLHGIRDYEERHRIAFAGSKQFAQVLRPEVMVLYAPQDQVAPDPGAPPEVAQAVERQRRFGEARKQQGLSSYLFARTQAEELRSVFDGSKCFVWREHLRRMVPAPDASHYYAPVMYLAGLGLRPMDPKPGAEVRESQQQFWFPGNFALYERCRVLPNEEAVDGAPCIVVEAERHKEWDGKRHAIADKIWFDPKVGLAPRQWEQRVDGIFESLRINSEFAEFAPGCWLPWECTWARGTPAWVAPELRNQPAYSYHMRLRKAQVNSVSDDLFKP
jgi:serine protease Do